MGDNIVIVMVGDSLTEEFRQLDSRRNPALAELKSRLKNRNDNFDILNMGKSGMTSGDWAATPYWWNEIEKYFRGGDREARRLAFVMLGTNDCAIGAPKDEYINNIRKIINRLKTLDITPVLQTIPPFAASEAADRVVREYNRGLRELGAEERVEILDIYGRFLDDDGNAREELYDYDMVHLRNEPGLAYDIWLDVLAEFITKITT
ncbi:MAG: hypothetical protein Kow0090_10290 [Myxococcota bacterium]